MRDTLPAHLLPLFDTMQAEADFAYAWLQHDLTKLPPGNALLEIGGGVFILSSRLASAGYNVTAIEPTGQGFGEFEELGRHVLNAFAAKPTIAPVRGEDFESAERFDFAYSINVMEHVDDPAAVIARVSATLKPGASYRFLCPNYAFPYEPHFNIPTVWCKRTTEKLFAKKIAAAPMHDAQGVWRSLNWITVCKLRTIAKRHPELTFTFARDTLPFMLERALSDPQFASRRSGWMISLIRLLVKCRLHKLAGLIPACLQPIIDCRITRHAELGSASDLSTLLKSEIPKQVRDDGKESA